MAGVYKDKKVDTLDPNQKERLVRSNFSKRTDCGALLCVIFEAGSWKVYKFVEEHNHDLVERPDKHFLPTERHLIQLQKHVIHSMSKLNLGLVKAFNVMKTCFGGFEDVGASKVEFKNYKRYAVVFVPFTGIDTHHCNVTFGAALLASETVDTYIWLLRVFLKAVGSQPKVVVTDQDPTMKMAISAVLVDTRHQLCMWHVMHKLSLKVGVRLCNSTNFKERICGVVWTDILSSEEFESEWEVVIGEFNLADNDWLSDIFALRVSWIPAYYRMEEQSSLMRTTSRSENKPSLYDVIEILFLAFFSLDIREFPKQYILNRWRKEASPNCSYEYSISREYMTELDPDVQSMMREIIFPTEYTLNRLSGNKEELSLYKDHVQSYMKKVQDMQIVSPPLVLGIELRRLSVNIKTTRIR
ncbi:protein FAR1-RELATED SEQUENCE 2-like [Helianthus annuus]|uniref:protein FAR1-RELATED SEQUENCE 2-like n=1 Tax=Helianthus annuus TaxID=4232 RepID=UPI000B8F1190|nr:protein FAR1-RELATED SEQUENCE 2-like [Helianthus annuus]